MIDFYILYVLLLLIFTFYKIILCFVTHVKFSCIYRPIFPLSFAVLLIMTFVIKLKVNMNQPLTYVMLKLIKLLYICFEIANCEVTNHVFNSFSIQEVSNGINNEEQNGLQKVKMVMYLFVCIFHLPRVR